MQFQVHQQNQQALQFNGIKPQLLAYGKVHLEEIQDYAYLQQCLQPFGAYGNVHRDLEYVQNVHKDLLEVVVDYMVVEELPYVYLQKLLKVLIMELFQQKLPQVVIIVEYNVMTAFVEWKIGKVLQQLSKVLLLQMGTSY